MKDKVRVRLCCCRDRVHFYLGLVHWCSRDGCLGCTVNKGCWSSCGTVVASRPHTRSPYCQEIDGRQVISNLGQLSRWNRLKVKCFDNPRGGYRVHYYHTFILLFSTSEFFDTCARHYYNVDYYTLLGTRPVIQSTLAHLHNHGLLVAERSHGFPLS